MDTSFAKDGCGGAEIAAILRQAARAAPDSPVPPAGWIVCALLLVRRQAEHRAQLAGLPLPEGAFGRRVRVADLLVGVELRLGLRRDDADDLVVGVGGVTLDDLGVLDFLRGRAGQRLAVN